MSSKYDVMLSYNWDTGFYHADQLETTLNNAGYTVWRDVNNMSGSLTDAMASAITNSELILLLTSKPYEESPNCTLEYKYANEQRKKIIQVKVEKFQPNPEKGLALIVADKLYFSLYDSQSYHENLGKLMVEVERVLGKEKSTAVDILSKPEEPKEVIVARTDKLRIKEKQFYMRLVSCKFAGRNSDGRKFAEQLLSEEYDEDKVNQIFYENPPRGYLPVLETICALTNDFGLCYEELVKTVDRALEESGFAGKKISKEEVEEQLKKLDLDYKHITFKNKHQRTSIYTYISQQANDIARFLGLFLLDDSDYQNLECSAVNSQPQTLVKSILDKWDDKTVPDERTWASIRQILSILRKKRVINHIEEKYAGQ